MRTISDTIKALPSPAVSELPAPPYECRSSGPRFAMAIESMKRHMTDEGWQIMQALEHAGYQLHGYNLSGITDAQRIMAADPAVMVVQDKREWEGLTAGGHGFDMRERFWNVDKLRGRIDVFKLTILKDAQHRPTYHRDAADEMGAHAWIVYYHPRIVKHLAPYVRRRHLIRTYHTLDRSIVPPYYRKGINRRGCLLSGAVSNAYPLRQRLVAGLSRMTMQVTHLKHPGYHRNGCVTPLYLKMLSEYRVAICTSSIYGYALRKIIEATACGCRVITDLPSDEFLPVIDSNLMRVRTDASVEEVRAYVESAIVNYDADCQHDLAEKAKDWYDYRAMGIRLADDIDLLRSRYADDERVR